MTTDAAKAATGTGGTRRVRYTLRPQPAAERARFLCLVFGDAQPQAPGSLSALRPEVCTVRHGAGQPDVSLQPDGRQALPLAAFSVIEASCIEEAIERVAELPCAGSGGFVEIRPLR